MAKKDELKNLIEDFGDTKTECDALKKTCESLNAQIKEIMSKKKLNEEESENYTAKYWIEQRESIDEEKVLQLFQNKMYEDAKTLGIIKTKEYIDSDALEDAIYHGSIAKEILLEMDKCREKQEIPKLKVSKIKRKEK